MEEQLRKYYEDEAPEELRLSTDSVQYTEFITLTNYFDRLIPNKSRILDPCAGTGAYSFYLAEQGHDVIAGDLLKVNVDALVKKQGMTSHTLGGIYKGDVRDLSMFGDNSFDVVLCMGALYHLLEKQDRLSALYECVRVLKRGGLLVATYINRLGALACNFAGDVDDIDELMKFLDEGIEGIFYADTPAGIEKTMSLLPLKMLHHVGLDGIGYLLNGVTNAITVEGLSKWRQYHLATCDMREILGYSYHAAYIGEKK